MSSPDLTEVTVTATAAEADRVVSIQLRRADGGPLPPFEAGAHIDVEVMPGVLRQYSLCSDPDDGGTYRLGVLLEEDSRGGSKAMHALTPGKRILISAPRTRFPLVETAGRSVLVAGGIGITPLMSMAYRLHRLNQNFELHYCARSYGRAAFIQELSQEPFGHRVFLHLDDGPDRQRFTTERFLTDHDEGTHLYVCGPGGFMDYVTTSAGRLGWSPGRLHVEHFANVADTSGGEFTVDARRSGIVVRVPPDRTIVDVLASNGVVVPVSCEQGVCGTCVTRVLEGVPDHRDIYLTDAEKAANNQMCVCCSRAKSAGLVLDI